MTPYTVEKMCDESYKLMSVPLDILMKHHFRAVRVSASMPESLKEEYITLLLKKIKLDLIHKNYRPVSNLKFLSVLEI